MHEVKSPLQIISDQLDQHFSFSTNAYSARELLFAYSNTVTMQSSASEDYCDP